jgi:hypothetical protein
MFPGELPLTVLLLPYGDHSAGETHHASLDDWRLGRNLCRAYRRHLRDARQDIPGDGNRHIGPECAAPRTGRVIQARQGDSFCPESGNRLPLQARLLERIQRTNLPLQRLCRLLQLPLRPRVLRSQGRPASSAFASPDGTTMTTVMMRADAQRRLDRLRSAIEPSLSGWAERRLYHRGSLRRRLSYIYRSSRTYDAYWVTAALGR